MGRTMTQKVKALKQRFTLIENELKIAKQQLEHILPVDAVVSLRLRHKYSGCDSKLFWELVNSMGERKQEFYSLGVVLQNLERWILTQMKSEAPNFVENEQASN